MIRHRPCLCGDPDWPGQCPGPAACPVHGQDLTEDDGPDPDEARERARDDAAWERDYGAAAEQGRDAA